MRKMSYLSPTSISKYYENRDEFYMIYLAGTRPPKVPQTRPMSVGSSFDAYAKSCLHELLFGKGADPKFEFTAIFEAQVEAHNRDWAIGAGAHAFDCYRKSGALADLILELQTAIGAPKFEIEIESVISSSRDSASAEVAGVPFHGRPDLHFFNREATHVTLDWKVNGFCSKSPVSPMPGYIRLRELNKDAGPHRDAMVMSHGGMMINVATYLENHNRGWANQLSVYSWLCGREVGESSLFAIDQLACGPDPFGGDRPRIRVAEHRLRITADFQKQVFERAVHVWRVANSGHFFHDLSKVESDEKCRLLDGVSEALVGEGTSEDKWFNEATRK